MTPAPPADQAGQRAGEPDRDGPCRPLALRLARRTVRHALASTFDGSADPVLVDTDPDPGIFGPDSVTWRVHADLSMFVGGLRALFAQSLHPLAMAGVAQHSRYREDPLGRLQRTAAFVVATTFGTTAEAEGAITAVRDVHRRVRGVADDGRRYGALDPALLAWVHHVEVDSFLAAYRAFGGSPISAVDADTYVAEMATLGERLGVPDPARTVRELRRWLATVPERRATGEARAAARFIVVPPLPIQVRPAYGVILGGALSLLSLRDRLSLWLPPTPVADAVLLRPATRALLGGLRWTAGPSPTLAEAHARVGGEREHASATR